VPFFLIGFSGVSAGKITTSWLNQAYVENRASLKWK